MSYVSTHVLDAAAGRAAAGIRVRLDHRASIGGRGETSEWRSIDQGVTDADGRVGALGPDQLPPGTYRITFATGEYFETQGTPAFYPEVQISFTTAPGETHYHVPLLLSPFAYSTYRGT